MSARNTSPIVISSLTVESGVQIPTVHICADHQLWKDLHKAQDNVVKDDLQMWSPKEAIASD